MRLWTRTERVPHAQREGVGRKMVDGWVGVGDGVGVGRWECRWVVALRLRAVSDQLD